ncbi:acid protease [Heliocybe sulcata]|uniref:Acid protease n=1 Tax=Heliocybe sulcata TaxID=5364 RepID=A0A5C3N3K0_9AGAM|nr:acid protease [Heliocybe sulcata]
MDYDLIHASAVLGLRLVYKPAQVSTKSHHISSLPASYYAVMWSLGLHILFCVGLLRAGSPGLAYMLPDSTDLLRRAAPRLSARDNITLQPIHLEDVGNAVYTVNITVAGNTIPVAVTTSTSDLWLFSLEATGINDTSLAAEVNYGGSLVSGTVSFADVALGQYTSVSQGMLSASSPLGFADTVMTAFLRVDNAVNMTVLFNLGIYGMLGLGLEDASVIRNIMLAKGYSSASSRTLPSNIFNDNPDISPFASMILGRTADQQISVNGNLTFGSYLPPFDVNQAEHLPVYTNYTSYNTSGTADPPTWLIAVDGIMGQNGSYTLNSSVPGMPSGKSLAVLEGFEGDSQVGDDVVNFIYSQFPGAVYYSPGGIWIVPCNASSNVAFNFGGQQIPINPLDLTVIGTQELSGALVTFCRNAFRSFTHQSPRFSSHDMILGSSFLRNVYTLFVYGDASNSTGATGDPYVQFLPTTNQTSASASFLDSREATLKSLPPELTPAEFVHRLQEHGGG